MSSTPNAAPQNAKHLVYGLVGDDIVFIEEQRALGLAAFHNAEFAATTWGDFMSRLPVAMQAEIRDLFEDEPPAESEPFNTVEIPGYGDGDWPFLEQEMLDFLPDSVIAMGEVYETTLNGPRLDIPSSAEAAAVAALQRDGWMVVRNDDLVLRARG